ncbi:MAG: shikimate dehydrogenase [Hyphomicrobiales bacterium]|nr:shikimate dehydrogenase [Hyphomicrobiales bacterium]
MTWFQNPEATRRYMMIGAPVTTVRSPPMLEAFFARHGQQAEVVTIHLEPAGLGDFMRSVRSGPRIDGLMVTMPHKKPIVRHLDQVTAVAGRAGSVNAVKRLSDGRWIGAQFDGIGLVGAARAAGAEPETASVLLAGLGGAGLAIAQALVATGCATLTATDTNTDLLEAVVESLVADGGPAVERLAPEAGPFDILVNATPLGMRDGDPSPFSEHLVAQARFVADIVADPPRTALAGVADTHGVPLITGRDMVAAQIDPIGQWLLDDSVEQMGE